MFLEIVLSSQRCIFNAARSWIDTKALASVALKFWYKSIGDNGVCALTNGGICASGTIIYSWEPRNLPLWKQNSHQQSKKLSKSSGKYFSVCKSLITSLNSSSWKL